MIRDLHVIVAYDITDDKRRRQLVKLLKGFGVRTQYSFFECLLSDAQLVKLKQGIRAIVSKDEDRVGIMHVCAPCFSRIFRIGYRPPAMFDETDVIA